MLGWPYALTEAHIRIRERMSARKLPTCRTCRHYAGGLCTAFEQIEQVQPTDVHVCHEPDE